MNPQRFMTIPPDEYRRPTPTNPNALRLDSNEGATPDAALLAAIGDTAASELRNYPHVAPLQRALAARWHIAEDGVVVTTGADDALDRCCRAFLGPDRSVVLPLPSFEMLHRFIEMTGADVRPVDWTAARFPVEEVIAAVRSDTGLVVIISPNNPTGSVASADDLRRVARAAPDAVVLLDHAYVEYADEDLTAAALALPNVVTVRTFSKAWGLAGCRVGYALTTPELARPLRNAGNPYPVAAPSIKAALHQLTHGEAMLEDHVALVRAERQRTLALLDELEVTTPLSEGNFVFPDFRDRSDVTDAILQFGGVLGRRFPHRANISGGIRISMPADADQLGILHHALRLAVRPDALLFDLDGVIADVSGSYRECVIRTVAHYGAQVTVDELQTIKLAGDANNDWVVTRRVLARRRIDVPLPEVTERYQTIYLGTDETPGLREEERLIPPPDLLQTLARRFPMALVTGRPRAEAEWFLDRYELRSLFTTIVTMDDGPVKPDPFPVRLAMETLGASAAWMVGDTPDDIVSARANGVVPIGIIPPGADRESTATALRNAGAVTTIDHLHPLLEWLP